MEYGSDRKEEDHSVRQGIHGLIICSDFPAYGREIHSRESTRDWFTSSNSGLMEASPPAPNEIYYDHEHVRSHYQTQQQQQHYYITKQQTPGLGLGSQIEREHMFDKVVTPSDVGKLNRLVIPKQHAEKYFPLDSSSNEKGLLLNFEDLTGKPWRFRYSYWNSSQSYVMTKGWSGFVKDKKLDAGDVVSFQRGAGEAEKHRLFIDWRRRPITATTTLPFHTQFCRSSWSPMMLRPPPLTGIHPSYSFQVPNPSSQYNYTNGYSVGGNYMGQVVSNNASVVYLTSPDQMIGMVRGRAQGVDGERIPVVFESVPVIQGKKVAAAAAAKRLRLFGVNMECPISSDTSTSDDQFEILSSSSLAIPVNSPAYHLNNQYPSSSTLFLPSSTRMYSGTPVSNKGKKSMSLDLDI